MRVMDVRSYHIKGCMEDGVVERKGKIHHTTPNLKERIKSLFNLMLDYAVEHEIIDRNYARVFDISDDISDAREEARRAHIAFTDAEITKLWDNLDKVNWVDVLLIQCYSGWRPQELGLIELKNVDLVNRTFKGGMKTAAGKDRVVPIHSKSKRQIVVNRRHLLISPVQALHIVCTAGSHGRQSPGRLPRGSAVRRYSR